MRPTGLSIARGGGLAPGKGGPRIGGAVPRAASPGGGRLCVALTAAKAYLPGTGDTVIHKAVPHGRGPSIALRSG